METNYPKYDKKFRKKRLRRDWKNQVFQKV